MSKALQRTRRLEVYALRCWRCAKQIELRVSDEQVHSCPNCKSSIVIEWSQVGRPPSGIAFHGPQSLDEELNCGDSFTSSSAESP